MTSLIIFSKDRALQLNLLLESIQRHCASLYDEIFVLYRVTSMNFELGYEKLRERWPNVYLVAETDFRGNVFSLMGECKNDIVCVLADDCIFFRNVDFGDQIVETIRRDDIASFSLGIGSDSVYSLNERHHFAQPSFTQEGSVLVWNWKTWDDKGEFGCPFMLASNFYKKVDYTQRLSAIEFNCPSWYEHNLQKKWQMKHGSPEDVATMPDLMACGTKQCMVHSMNNVVQDVFGNPHGEDYYHSAAELNLRYLGGQVVDLYALDFEAVDGLHKEIKFVFTKEDRIHK